MAKFSIIVPVHNTEAELPKCLESIINQTYKDYELILICDSCTDNSVAIAKNYERFATACILEEQEYHNDGLSRSRGLDLATGEWVMFLDSDDWWLHEYVLQQIAQRLIGIDPYTDILAMSFVWKGVKYAGPRSNGGRHYPAVWNKCWKRSFIGSTRFPNIPAVSDGAFWQEICNKQPRIVDWDMPIYYYNYLRKGSISERRALGKVSDSHIS